MNKNKRFILLGTLSIAMIAGCTSSTQTIEEDLDVKATGTTGQLNQQSQNEQADTSTVILTTEAAKDEDIKGEDIKDEKANDVQSILNLKLLVGEKSDKVRETLGEPKESKKLEETTILLADYYTKEVLGQKVSVEFVYDDEDNKVNFINMKCVQTDDVEEFVKCFDIGLTNVFGEGNIEKTIDVRGTKSKEWGDGVLTYVLSYVEADVKLDIYPIHE